MRALLSLYISSHDLIFHAQWTFALTGANLIMKGTKQAEWVFDKDLNINKIDYPCVANVAMHISEL